MNNKSYIHIRLAAILIISLTVAAFITVYFAQTISAQIAKESGFRVTNNVSCQPDNAINEDVHFSGCSSRI